MKIRQWGSAIIVASVFVLTGFVSPGTAGVEVNVGVFAPPPPYVITSPPPVVVIPGTYVYSVPDAQVDILFYHGYWWRPFEGRWYRSSHYNGSWKYFPSERIPRAVRELPPDHRHYRPADGRISHEDLKRNWKTWERDRHWDKHEERTDHGGHGGNADHGEHGDHGEGHRGR